MTCPRQLEVQAYLDGEMDGASSVAIERHIEGCAACTAFKDDLESIRSAIRGLPYHAASTALQQMVDRALKRENGGARPTAFWKGAASGGVGVALAASLVLFLLRPVPQDEIAHDVVTAHLRSLVASQPVDVVSSDHHTVKPWFDGRTDVAPVAENFAKQGFVLVGGRVDYVHGMRAAVLVYRHGAHVVNVFAWKNDGSATPGLREKNGYTLLAWQKGDVFYCAISDTSARDLKNLEALIQSRA